MLLKNLDLNDRQKNLLESSKRFRVKILHQEKVNPEAKDFYA